MMDDLISRAAVIEALDRFNVCGYVEEPWEKLIDALQKLSAAEQEDCSTCKHGYFGSLQCNNCRVRYPSHYERCEDEGSD